MNAIESKHLRHNLHEFRLEIRLIILVSNDNCWNYKVFYLFLQVFFDYKFLNLNKFSYHLVDVWQPVLALAYYVISNINHNYYCYLLQIINWYRNVSIFVSSLSNFVNLHNLLYNKNFIFLLKLHVRVFYSNGRLVILLSISQKIYKCWFTGFFISKY